MEWRDSRKVRKQFPIPLKLGTELLRLRRCVLLRGGVLTSTVSLRIVEATEQDIPLILQFIRELAVYEKHLDYVENNEDRLRRTIFSKDRGIHAIIAYEGEVPVGYAVFYYTYSTFVGRRGLYLEDLYVKPESRGKGFGRALLSYLARTARAHDCWRMEWAVLNWNQPAITFYQGLGAVPMNEWTTYRISGAAMDRLADD